MDNWILQEAVEPEQVLYFSKLIDLAISSDSQEQLCQKIVHGEITQGLVLGAHLYSVDSNLDMELQISYGKTSHLVEQVVSAWGSSPLSKCLVERKMQFESGKDVAHVALPLLKSGLPVGAMNLVMSPTVKSIPLSEPVSNLLSRVWGFFVEVKPLHSIAARANGHGDNNRPEQLSKRQVQIIQLVASGFTNARIGKELSLSESTVRQETIKIYKCLEVSGRHDAAKAAMKMGLVSSSL
jgi:DNA-binding CsgD family transcriptional regulator